jgi:hypothetical protein
MPSLSDFLDKADTWPVAPAHGWEYAVPDAALSILGNDQWGDCACAGALHLIQAQSYNTGRPVQPTTADALSLYSAVTGFNINAGPSGDNPTDQGTALTDLLTYWQKIGVQVGVSAHKILAYAALDVSSLAQMKWAAYTFGGLYLGIQCPEQCQQNTSNWNFAPGLKPEGGHCIVQLGEGAAGGTVNSWGMKIPMSNEFMLGYIDEGYVIVTEDWVNQNSGKTPSGLDLTGLLAAAKKV